MKKLFWVPLCLVVFFAACNKDEVEINCEQNGPPIWVNQPGTVSGATSIDFALSINQKSKIYYTIYDSKQNGITSETLKSDAGKSATGPRIANGIIEINCDEINSDYLLDVLGLPDNTTLFAYFVAESQTLDTLLQENVTELQVEMLEKQPTHTFASTVEARDVLYLAYQPEDELKQVSTEPYPLLIFLGGNGEKSTQGNINLIRNGSIPEYLNKGNEVPMIVVSPQHIVNTWNADMLDEMVTEAIAKYPVDENRIYMTGISGGGIGTWNYSVKYAERLAAIVPISGDGNDSKACDLVDLAVWAFHNDTDGTVATSGSVNMINAINACSPQPSVQAKITLFSDDGHNCWRRVYDKEHGDWSKDQNVAPIDIYEWLLQYSK